MQRIRPKVPEPIRRGRFLSAAITATSGFCRHYRTALKFWIHLLLKFAQETEICATLGHEINTALKVLGTTGVMTEKVISPNSVLVPFNPLRDWRALLCFFHQRRLWGSDVNAHTQWDDNLGDNRQFLKTVGLPRRRDDLPKKCTDYHRWRVKRRSKGSGLLIFALFFGEISKFFMVCN